MTFQSSPVTKDGRYRAGRCDRHGCSMFQSSPVTKDGRYQRGGLALVQRRLFQSSPVTKDGRYGRTTGQRAYCHRFNPRPSLRTGATVSPQRWGVLPLWFQSSPVTKDGRYCEALMHYCRFSVFQSSPVTKDGRYGRRGHNQPCHAGFNPRPSLRTGATARRHSWSWA